jgi:rifampin ADP-ribosylating transferase
MTGKTMPEPGCQNHISAPSARSGKRRFYHGTRDDLRPGEVIAPANPSASVCVSPDLDAAIWDAELARGDGQPRVYVVETDGQTEEASERLSENAPRHPFMSWRSSGQVRVESEVTQWTYYHGTRVKLRPGDTLVPGSNPNFGRTLNHVYLTRTLDAAIWAAELALGEGSQRIYLVEPTGPIEDDPNVTDKKFRGNPTKSFRSRDPLRVTGEVAEWKGHSKETLEAMKAGLAKLAHHGIGPIDD